MASRGGRKSTGKEAENCWRASGNAIITFVSTLLPLFPLQLVVFPGSAVPLHVFEQRYRRMVGEAEAADSEFGIVLARDGGIVNAGCTVRVEQVLERYPDGRFDVVTRGQRRFLITGVDQEKDYLRGHVEFYEDDDWTPVTESLRRNALNAYERMRLSLRNIDEAGPELAGRAPDPAHPLLGFELAQTVEDLDFQSIIQRSRSEVERLRKFTEFVDTWVPQQQYVAKLKRAAPTNGFGHKPPGL